MIRRFMHNDKNDKITITNDNDGKNIYFSLNNCCIKL